MRSLLDLKNGSGQITENSFIHGWVVIYSAAELVRARVWLEANEDDDGEGSYWVGLLLIGDRRGRVVVEVEIGEGKLITGF